MRNNHLIALFLLVSMLFLATASDARQISDEQKKEIVYQKYSDYKKEFPTVQDIHPLKAMKLLDKGKVLFVDTRTPAEMSVSLLMSTLIIAVRLHI